MEKKHQNIEDLFKSSFDNYKIEPTANMWNNIDKKVRYTNAYNSFIEFLKSYSVTPSATVWNNINKQLLFLNFLQFNLRTFNVFYLLLIISAASGITYYSINPSKSINYIVNNTENKITTPTNKHLQISNKETTSKNTISATNQLIDNKIHIAKNTIAFQNNESPKIENNPKPTNEDITALKTISNNKKTNATITSKNTHKTEKFNNPTENTTNNNAKQIDQPTNNLPIASNEPLANSLISNKQFVKGIRKAPKPKINHKTDTIYKIDSTRIKYKNAIDANQLSKWSVDICVSQLFSKKEVTTNSTSYQLIKDAKVGEDESVTTYAVGVGVNYSIAKTYIQLGIAYTTLGEDFNYTLNAYNVDSSEVIGYNNYNETNQYTYLEIPIIIGYKFNIKKITLYTKTGINLGLLQQVKGVGIDPNNTDIIYQLNKNNNFTIPTYTFIAGLGVSVPIKNKISILLEPYYRQNIKSIYNDAYYTNLKFKTWGISFGIRYNL